MDLPNHDVISVDVHSASPPVAIYGQSPDKLPHSNTRVKPQQTHNNGSNRLEDFADYTPGVQLGRNQAGIGNDIYLRGYALNGNMQLDGLLDVQGFYLRDPATLDSIEINKGLNSVLFGSGSPGGTINYISKQPHFSPQRSVQLTTGSPDNLHTVLDINQPFAQTHWAGRLLMVGQQAETGRANVGDDRFTLLPSLLWQTEQQSLLLTLEHGWQNREYDFDNVFYQGKPIYNVSYVDPRSYAKRHMHRLSATHTRDWGKGWETLLQINQIDAKRDERWIGFAYLPANGTTLPGYYRDAQYAQTQQALRAEISRHYTHGISQHHTRLGVSGHSVEIDLKRQFRTGLFSLDLFNPSFDFPLPDTDKLIKREGVTLRKERAVYLQHDAEISDRWGIHAGVRNSQYQADYASPTLAFQETDATDTSTALGLTWQLTPHLQTFASRYESFAPNIGMDKNDRFFAPLQGVQHEIGVRHQHKTDQSKSVKSKLSVYRIDQENVTTRDPSEPGALMLTGKTRSQGAEANISIPISKKLTVNTAYNYSDARITANNDGNTGNHLHNIPRHSGSLTLDYTPNTRTHLTLGAVKVGKRPGDDANSFEVPAYTRLDAGATWQLNRNTTLKAGVRNLLNEDYVAASEGVDFIVQGRKRTVTLGLEVDF